jgi:carboxylate-amine ligase
VAALTARRRSGQRLPVHESYRLSENRWRALRDGLEATLIDPDTGLIEPVRERLARLLSELEAQADELGCASELAHAWTLLEANGATRQRAIASQRGPSGLLDWLADETERSASERPAEAGDTHARPASAAGLVPEPAAAAAGIA